MKFHELSRSKIGWLTGYNEKDGIIISSRIRLARNLNGFPFPHRATREQQKVVYEKTESVIRACEIHKKFFFHKLSSLSDVDKAFLVERHLISYDHTRGEGEKGVAFSEDEKISIMINEEDHLRIQILGAGLSLFSLWETINGIDNKLSEYLDYSYNKKYGFLTACPTNLGTGLRASCLLHLPAIIMSDMLEKIKSSLSKLNVNIRGFYGEGTEPIGDMIQISNSNALGKSEDVYVEDIVKVTNTLVKYEKEQREKIFSNKSKYKFEDQIYRAYATLLYGRILSSSETVNALSKVRLGVSEGLKDINVPFDTINNLIFNVLPAHLQQIFNKELSPQARDIIRAEYVRNILKNL